MNDNFVRLLNRKTLHSKLNRSKAPKQEPQEERDARVIRIEIDSNNSTYATGRKIPLFAVPYDVNDNPVSGVKFEWEIEDSDGNRQEITDDIFTAKADGEYTVMVRGAGQESVGKYIIKNPSDNFWTDYNIKSETQQLLPFDE